MPGNNEQIAVEAKDGGREMKRDRKNIVILGLLLTAVLCLTVIVYLLWNRAAYINGLSGAENAQEDGAGKERMSISIGMWDIGQKLARDEVLSAIEDKFDIILKPVNVNYTNWTQEYQKMAASDSLPDIIVHDIIGSATYSAWLAQGIIRPLPSKLKDYPNLEAYMDSEYIQNFKESDGGIYFVPRMTYPEESLWALDRCIVVRKDWLEELKLELPQNDEEFREVLKAFTNSDFDGDGEKNTIGLATENMNTLEAIYLSVFPELSNIERGWMQEEGRWMPVYASKRTGEALAYTKELYDSGLLDRQFPYRTIPEAFSLFTEGKSGALCCQYFNLVKYWDETDPDHMSLDKIAVIKPWPAEDGNRYSFTSSLHWSELYFSSGVSDAKMDRILKLFDYLLSEEAKDLFYHDGDTEWLNQNPSIEVFSTLVSWNQQEFYEKSPSAVGIYGEENLDYAIELMDWYRNNTTTVHYNNKITFLSTPSKLLLPTYQEIKDDMIQTIMGKKDAKKAWEEVLEKYRSETPLEAAIKEVTALTD